MRRKSVNQAPVFIDALVAVGFSHLNKLPVSHAQAAEAMDRIASDICRMFGRTTLYVPFTLAADRLKRDDLIRQQYGKDGDSGAVKYTGERVKELAREHSLTVAHVYQILRQRPPAGAGQHQAAEQAA